MNVIIPLWSIPRSVSTGFERMMMERGDFKVIHEPFSYFFYAKEQAAAAVGMNVDPDHPQDFDDILAMIRRRLKVNRYFSRICPITHFHGWMRIFCASLKIHSSSAIRLSR
jgi:hypothetical protein